MIIQGDKHTIMNRARSIKLLLLDVDGVLTDGRLFIGSNGEVIKVFNSLDGHGIKLLQRAGVVVGIISGRDSEPLTWRANELGIRLLYTGREDKLTALEEISHSQKVMPEEMAFAGDDLPDLAVINRVGLGISVPNAHIEVKKMANLLTEVNGGEGAVREICDFLLQARGDYEPVVRESLGSQ